MREVHFMLQGKGGVGKSFCASILGQYLQQNSGKALHCFDTDPNNRTLSAVSALNAEIVSILTKHETIDTRQFDEMFEKLVSLDGIGVIDNGSSSFAPLMGYLIEADLIQVLADNGVRVVMHVVMVGGQALNDCLKGLSKVLSSTQADVVVWINDFQGEVQEGGKNFFDFKVYQSNKKRILGVVHIPSRAPDTFGKDIYDMTKNNLTFAEALDNHELFKLAARSRLIRVRDEVFAQLAKLPIGNQTQDAN